MVPIIQFYYWKEKTHTHSSTFVFFLSHWYNLLKQLDPGLYKMHLNNKILKSKRKKKKTNSAAKESTTIPIRLSRPRKKETSIYFLSMCQEAWCQALNLTLPIIILLFIILNLQKRKVVSREVSDLPKRTYVELRFNQDSPNFKFPALPNKHCTSRICPQPMLPSISNTSSSSCAGSFSIHFCKFILKLITEHLLGARPWRSLCFIWGMVH